MCRHAFLQWRTVEDGLSLRRTAAYYRGHGATYMRRVADGRGRPSLRRTAAYYCGNLFVGEGFPLPQTRQINKTLCGAIYITVQNAAVRPQNGAACRVATRRREINPRPTVVRTVARHHGHGVTYMRRVADGRGRPSLTSVPPRIIVGMALHICAEWRTVEDGLSLQQSPLVIMDTTLQIPFRAPPPYTHAKTAQPKGCAVLLSGSPPRSLWTSWGIFLALLAD